MLHVTARSPSPAQLPSVLQEDAAPSKQLHKVGGAQQKLAGGCSSPARGATRRPAPLKVMQIHPRPELPLVVADDSKPAIGDLGTGLTISSFLRLPGLPF